MGIGMEDDLFHGLFPSQMAFILGKAIVCTIIFGGTQDGKWGRKKALEESTVRIVSFVSSLGGSFLLMSYYHFLLSFLFFNPRF